VALTFKVISSLLLQEMSQLQLTFPYHKCLH
jgi:hypothetical protein